MTFWVTVAYREPTYEAKTGRKPEPYHWTFEIDAADEPSAGDEALRRFRQMEQMSGVSWVRQIVAVTVARPTVDGAGPDGPRE